MPCPPGDYYVSRVSYLPLGTGTRTYGENSFDVHYLFNLAPDIITIFDQSFNLLTYNPIPGRGNSTSYSFDIDPVTDEQGKQIMETLGALENFDSYKVK